MSEGFIFFVRCGRLHWKNGRLAVNKAESEGPRSFWATPKPRSFLTEISSDRYSETFSEQFYPFLLVFGGQGGLVVG
jgi:hypothetical protein